VSKRQPTIAYDASKIPTSAEAIAGEGLHTARKKSLMSCVMYTAKPMLVKWNR
jgi:hypothetical protein